MPSIKLWSARACPFAHRTRLVLAEKQLEFELIEINLQNKPVWFSEVSVHSKVPALEHAGKRFVESAIINEYLDEAFPSPLLLPQGAPARAVARFWIDYANTRFVSAWGKLLRAQTEAIRAEASGELAVALDAIERSLTELSVGGPFWFGSELSLVDLSFYPWFERWPALEHYRGAKVPAIAGRVRRWVEALSELASVTSIENPISFYVERYAHYAAPTASAAIGSPIIP